MGVDCPESSETRAGEVGWNPSWLAGEDSAEGTEELWVIGCWEWEDVDELGG